MGRLLSIAAITAALLTAASAQIRVRLNPSNVRSLAEPDFHTWTIESESQNASTTVDNVSFGLSADSQLEGNYFKYQYTRAISHLGERVVNQGITAGDESGDIVLSIKGLSKGEHTLLAWHNAWDAVDSIGSVSVSVNGEKKTSAKQSVRVDNIWEAATSYVTFSVNSEDEEVKFSYAPSGSSQDVGVILNGFEIDTPAIGNQISFPSPNHRDERIQPENGNGIIASWRAPSSAKGATYNVYQGTATDELKLAAKGLNKTETSLSGLNTMDTFYWRVDVLSGGKTYTGRTFTFRLAHLAFPGAEGYGRFARGGRGGKVVKVTTLEDSEAPGTLRHALTNVTGPRIVVFDVGGVITTKSRLSITDSYITVAGETAPGKGIVVQGQPFGLSGASDVILRHIRTRPGTSSNETVDGMGMAGSNYCILDHCSMGWSIDESFSSRNAKNITFQRNMISEPLNVAGHKNYPAGTEHGYAATIGGDISSIHHNLIAHAEGRSWSMGGGVDDNSTFAGRLDIRNNVVYNFGSRVTDGGAMEVNFVGNLYKQGPASELTYALRAQYEDNMPGKQQYYCAGNSMPGVFDQDSEQYPSGDGTSENPKIACFADVSIDPAPEYQKFFDEPFFPSYIKEQTSTEAYKRVLSDSGASQPVLDDHDTRIIHETLNGSYTYRGSKSGKKGLIDNEADAGGLEDYPKASWPETWDADNNGIADWWDGSTGGDGYTAIEGYLHFMAEPHVFVTPGGSVKFNLRKLAAGFKTPSFKVSGGKLGSVKTSGGLATYTSSGDAGVDHFTVNISDSEGSEWERTVGVGIFKGADSLS
ncbi:hypothetical protein N8T08_001974 [Aspergillus melleus]|uniref:Uncharacterized protein n=1 Tax=Aspergillus melleus TaxID=138277 RepID=A0ACC3B9D6_9EURO|nr:hypothetical protein N8T08_001974 [Aspergillus melleus]